MGWIGWTAFGVCLLFGCGYAGLVFAIMADGSDVRHDGRV